MRSMDKGQKMLKWKVNIYLNYRKNKRRYIKREIIRKRMVASRNE